MVKTNKFNLEELISFGHYVRKNTDKVMRLTYIDWQKQFVSFRGKSFK